MTGSTYTGRPTGATTQPLSDIVTAVMAVARNLARFIASFLKGMRQC
jgi:hypothetical protein